MSARDLVFVHGLEAATVIGVHPHERLAPQRLLLDLEVACDAAAAAAGDDLAKAVDYDALATRVRQFVASQQPRLLETLAEALAAHLRSTLGIAWVRVRITKPGVVAGTLAVGVLLERGQRPADAARP